MSLEPYLEIGLRDARTRRDEADALPAEEINPSQHRENKRQSVYFATEHTFESVYDKWLQHRRLSLKEGRQRSLPLIPRREHESVLEETQSHFNNATEMMRIRKRTVEHPFGTLKHWMGATHFQTRKLAGVSAEMSLNVLAYNLKRVMKNIGADSLMKALSA